MSMSEHEGGAHTAMKRREELSWPGTRAPLTEYRSDIPFRGWQEGATGYPLAGVPEIEKYAVQTEKYQ